MYLRAEKYVSGNPHFDPEDAGRFDTLVGMFDDPAAKEAFTSVQFPSARIVFTVGYWRKANQIHSWFVRECQDGRDECQVTYVPREKLVELRELCLRVLAAQGKENEQEAIDALEPRGGFFFGSTDINEWYWQDIRETVEQLDRALGLPGGWSLYYQSSW